VSRNGRGCHSIRASRQVDPELRSHVKQSSQGPTEKPRERVDVLGRPRGGTWRGIEDGLLEVVCEVLYEGDQVVNFRLGSFKSFPVSLCNLARQPRWHGSRPTMGAAVTAIFIVAATGLPPLESMEGICQHVASSHTF
jgi:hypothetical protein